MNPRDSVTGREKKGSPPLAPDTFVKVQAEAVHDYVGAARFGGADTDAVDALFGAPRTRHAHTDFVIQFLDFATAQCGPIANGLFSKNFGTRHKHPDFKNFARPAEGVVSRLSSGMTFSPSAFRVVSTSSLCDRQANKIYFPRDSACPEEKKKHGAFAPWGLRCSPFWRFRPLLRPRCVPVSLRSS